MNLELKPGKGTFMINLKKWGHFGVLASEGSTILCGVSSAKKLKPFDSVIEKSTNTPSFIQFPETLVKGKHEEGKKQSLVRPNSRNRHFS